MTDAVIDATATEVVAVGRELTRHEVLRPLDVGEQREAMALYQEGLHRLLDETDWQDAGRGERFVKKSGWRKIAAWFSLSIELVRDSVDRAEDGSVQRAQVWARAIAPNGRYADADGYCDVSESRFARNKAKLENDLRGTATTRAINRAISNLVGMGAVSHEEMVATDAGPPLGPPTNDAQFAQLRRAVGYVLDADPAAKPVDGVIEAIHAKAGVDYFPLVATQAIGALAGALKRQRESEIRDADSDVTDDAAIDEALRAREDTP